MSPSVSNIRPPATTKIQWVYLIGFLKGGRDHLRGKTGLPTSMVDAVQRDVEMPVGLHDFKRAIENYLFFQRNICHDAASKRP